MGLLGIIDGKVFHHDPNSSGRKYLRIFLPMFGMLGLDYGWRLDDVPNQPNMPRGTFHFSIGANLGDL